MGRRVVVREAREGKEGIWTEAKAQPSAKHTVQECQQTPSHPVLYQKRDGKKKENPERETVKRTFEHF